MKSGKIVAYWPVEKMDFPDLEWKPIEDDGDPERRPYYKRFNYMAEMPTSDPRFLQEFRLEDEGQTLTEPARKIREELMKQTLLQEGMCALLFSK